MATIIPSASRLGATVEDVDLAGDLTSAEIGELREALNTHEVLFFPDQHLEPSAQVRFGSTFGQLQRHAALDTFADLPEMVVFDTAESAVTAEWWHTDSTCEPRPRSAPSSRW